MHDSPRDPLLAQGVPGRGYVQRRLAVLLSDMGRFRPDPLDIMLLIHPARSRPSIDLSTARVMVMMGDSKVVWGGRAQRDRRGRRNPRGQVSIYLRNVE